MDEPILIQIETIDFGAKQVKGQGHMRSNRYGGLCSKSI